MENKDMLSVFVSNFFTYDFLVFLLGGLNIFILFKTRQYSRKLFSILNPTGWLPGGDESLHDLQNKYERQKLREEELVYLRRKSSAYYQIYENVTALFPLLGILGTVVSLIPMVNAIGEATAGYFFSALTSTFWGLVFAIGFKAANGLVSGQLEDNEKNVAVYLERNTNAMKAAAMSEAVRQSVENAAQDVQAAQEAQNVPETRPRGGEQP